jgi:hypothetical protein
MTEARIEYLSKQLWEICSPAAHFSRDARSNRLV